ncbi:MAG: hypothetical protein LBJ31_09500 [Treponema sp.]|jgi:hypothetical protein|nr:hypothetical protein [Treponema sp.]
MALLSGNDTVPQDQVVKSADGKAAFKAKKLEALKRFKERRAQKVQEAYKEALALRDELVKAGLLDKLTAGSKDFVLGLCKDPAEKKVGGGFGGPSVFTLVFGDNPKVGQEVTLEQAFMKTAKGKSTLDVWVRRWAEKGIVIDVQLNKNDVLQTKYIIKSLAS